MNKKYFRLRLKRNFKIYPTIILITVITLLCIAITCGVLLLSDSSGEKQKKISLGIVGNMNDTYLDIGLNVLKNADSSGFYINWVEFEDEKDAVSALEKRKISGYIHIPDDYIKSIYRGKNKPARYVTLNAPEGFGTIISSEIAKIISDVVVESQVGMYSMQEVGLSHRAKGMGRSVAELTKRYIDLILNRNDLYCVTVLGIADSLSFAGYYICSLFLVFMLLWGISCNRIFSGNSTEYSKILANAGVTVRQQIMAEYKAYFVVTGITMLLLTVAFGIVTEYISPDVPELVGVGALQCVGYLIKILPVIVMITAMQYAIYELVPNTIAAILTQFIFIVVLGYISGCFYPNYFFPDIVQDISELLPVGAGFSYMRKAMTGLPSLRDFAPVAGYILAFFALSYHSKKYKITGDAR